MFKFILLIVLILLFLIIFKTRNSENFRTPIKQDYKFLKKCFDENEINTFNKYYKYSDVIKTNNSIIFLTPNEIIDENPQLTWNGVFLNNLCVDPKYRNKGFASNLLKFVIEKMKDYGKDHIILQVHNSNTKAINLYKKLGFIKYSEGLNDNNEKILIYILYL